jgi:hypothetical protein
MTGRRNRTPTRTTTLRHRQRHLLLFMSSSSTTTTLCLLLSKISCLLCVCVCVRSLTLSPCVSGGCVAATHFSSCSCGTNERPGATTKLQISIPIFAKELVPKELKDVKQHTCKFTISHSRSLHRIFLSLSHTLSSSLSLSLSVSLSVSASLWRQMLIAFFVCSFG